MTNVTTSKYIERRYTVITCEYRVEERTSKSGKPYKVIIFRFKNGYELVEFLNNEQEYIIGLNK